MISNFYSHTMANFALFLLILAMASTPVRGGSCIGEVIQSSDACSPAMLGFMCDWYEDCRVVEGIGCSLKPCSDFDAEADMCIEKNCTYSEIDRTMGPTTEEPGSTIEPTDELTMEPSQSIPVEAAPEIGCYGTALEPIRSLCSGLSSDFMCTGVGLVCIWSSGQCIASCLSIASSIDCLDAGCVYGEIPEPSNLLDETSNSDSIPNSFNENSSFSIATKSVAFALIVSFVASTFH